MTYKEFATQITVAAMRVGDQSKPGDNIHRADEVAAFYETIAKKIIEVEKQRLKGNIG